MALHQALFVFNEEHKSPGTDLALNPGSGGFNETTTA